MTLTTETQYTDQNPDAGQQFTDAQAAVLGALLTNPGTTVPELATAARVSASTVNKTLILLADMGLAARTVHEPLAGKRIAATWTPSGRVTEEAGQADEDEAQAEGEAADVEGESGENTAGQEPDDAAAAHHGSESSDAHGEPVQAQPGGRLGSGVLRELVAERLVAQPDTEFSPSMISKALDRSAGAVANCLEKLVGAGVAEVTNDKPRRFRHLEADRAA